jgi:RHS repeat-associated protein
VVKPTTYALDPIRYEGAGPHQVSQIGALAYKYDADGSFLGTQERGKWQRRVIWDAARRARSVSDGGGTTDYTYDDSGRLAIERGKQAETVYVNRWFTVRSGNITKHIWADADRLATQQLRDVDGDGDLDRRNYYLHKDLQGSTNVATDDEALVFQHLEYFPSGEPWVVEESNQYQTPYLFTGSYWEENRRLTNHGERWYDAREMFFYSPEPLLSEDPPAAIDDPAMLPAYTYAESNPLRLVDITGRDASSVLGIPASTVKTGGPSGITLPGPNRTKGFRFDDDVVGILASLKSSRLADWQFDLAVSTRADRISKLSERFEGRALITIDVGEISGTGPRAIGRLFAGLASIKEVKFGLPFHKGRYKHETKAGKAAAQAALNQAAAQTPAATTGSSAGGAAGGANVGTSGAPAAPASPAPQTPASNTTTPPTSTKSP